METFLKAVVGVVAVIGMFIVIAGILALPVMWMWDYVMPDVFGLPEVTFWQALWGTLLARFLFTDSGVNASKK